MSQEKDFQKKYTTKSKHLFQLGGCQMSLVTLSHLTDKRNVSQNPMMILLCFGFGCSLFLEVAPLGNAKVSR